MARQQTGEIVVVGSGITGLCLGALLVHAGHPVRVLEAHPAAIGGHARTLTFGGLEFSAGPRYVWGFGKAQVGQRVLEALGLETETPFIRMDPEAFERLAVGERPPVAIPMGLERYVARMVEMFPREAPGIRRFFAVVRDIHEASRHFNDNSLFLLGPNQMRLGLMLADKLSLGHKLKALRYRRWTLKDLFDGCRLSQPARRLLYGHSGDFAENETHLSLLLYAASLGCYHQGAYVPATGFGGLVKALGRSIEKNGEVLSGKRVTRLATDGAGVTRVDCADGTQYPCRAVVSTLSPRLTARLLPGGLEEHYTYRSSNSLNVFCMGVTRLPHLVEDLRLKNLWWQDGSSHVDYDRPDTTQLPQMIYLGSHTAHREQLAAGDTLLDVTAMTPGSFEQSRAAYHRGAENYAAYKDKLADRLLQGIERYLYPGFRSHIQFIETLTPMDLHLELGAEDGSTYGRRMDTSSFLRGAPPQLPFTNLHMASATVGLEGIPVAFQTAVHWLYKLTGSKV